MRNWASFMPADRDPAVSEQLAQAFVAEATATSGSPSNAGTEADDDLQLSLALAQALGLARQRFPKVTVAPETFARHLARLLPTGSTRSQATAFLTTVHVADVYLALACAHGESRALAAFEELLESEVSAALSRMAPDEDFIDEVRQQLRHHLLLGDGSPRVLGFSGKGPLSKWVRAAALRTGLTLRRARTPDGDLEELAEAPAPGDNPELEYLKRRHRAEFTEAFGIACASLSAQERNLLRLHLLDGLTFGEIGAHYQAHRSTVMRWVDAARQRLYDEVRRILSERLSLSRGEFDSLVGAIRSELDLRLSRFLRSQTSNLEH
jgi:RNA polymerase sigma-70 factor (ECF subfamily)